VKKAEIKVYTSIRLATGEAQVAVFPRRLKIDTGKVREWYQSREGSGNFESQKPAKEEGGFKNYGRENQVLGGEDGKGRENFWGKVGVHSV